MLKRIWCWLFHWKYHRSSIEGSHSVYLWCDKCGNEKWYFEL